MRVCRSGGTAPPACVCKCGYHPSLRVCVCGSGATTPPLVYVYVRKFGYCCSPSVCACAEVGVPPLPKRVCVLVCVEVGGTAPPHMCACVSVCAEVRVPPLWCVCTYVCMCAEVRGPPLPSGATWRIQGPVLPLGPANLFVLTSPGSRLAGYLAQAGGSFWGVDSRARGGPVEHLQREGMSPRGHRCYGGHSGSRGTRYRASVWGHLWPGGRGPGTWAGQPG